MMTAQDLAVFLIAGVTIRKPGQREGEEAKGGKEVKKVKELEDAEERTSGARAAAGAGHGLAGRASLCGARVCHAAPSSCWPDLRTKNIKPS
jgi:hypothetical protein